MNINQNQKVIFSNVPSIIKMSEAKFANLFFLEISINDVPITVMFDTGATMTVLKESIVKLIGAQATGNRIIAGGSAGNTKELQTVLLNKVQLGSHEVLHREVIVVPDEALDFGLDDEGNKFKADGFLGWDMISLFKWTINRDNGTYIIEKSFKKEVQPNLSWRNFPLLEVNWQDKVLYLGFDSGHTDSMLGVKMFEQIENLESTIETTIGLGGSLDEEIYRLKEFDFKIGNTVISLRNITVLEREIFGQESSDMAGLLGADIVYNRQWVLDFPNEYFEVN